MTPMLKLTAVSVLAALLLAGCKSDGGGGGGSSDRDPQENFGRTFASAFDAEEGDDAIDPEPGDAGELSLTDDPIDF